MSKFKSGAGSLFATRCGAFSAQTNFLSRPPISIFFLKGPGKLPHNVPRNAEVPAYNLGSCQRSADTSLFQCKMRQFGAALTARHARVGGPCVRRHFRPNFTLVRTTNQQTKTSWRLFCILISVHYAAAF